MKKKSKKRKINIFKIMWVGGIYLLLIFILYLVIIYKVKWEYVTENEDNKKYVYFYECDDKVCLSKEKLTNYYSRLECITTCPVIKSILDNNIVIIEYNGELIEYNYLTGDLKEEG